MCVRVCKISRGLSSTFTVMLVCYLHFQKNSTSGISDDLQRLASELRELQLWTEFNFLPEIVSDALLILCPGSSSASACGDGDPISSSFSHPVRHSLNEFSLPSASPEQQHLALKGICG